jgi:SPP1 gp7 family putative phage head morphogenesis protein
VAKDWSYGIGANIGPWAQEEINQFRQELSGLIYQGKRFGTKEKPGELERAIMDRYGAKIRATIAPGVQLADLTEKQKQRIAYKANFIARNESRLLMTTYKYKRMQNSGSTFFRWLTVVGSPKHPVRPSHKILNRKVWRWDNPPIDEQTGKQVLPGQAYNCRCTAVPLWDSDIATDAKGNFKQLPDGSYVLK